jgi:hypothetical protein
MFILGHVGLACGAVHAIDRRADLRWVPVVALLPDLIDKPLWAFVPIFANGWTRSAGHSLTGLAIFAAFAIWRLRERAWPLLLAYASHLILDRMWWDGHILVWPFEGFWLPEFTRDHMELWWEKMSEPWTLGGEVLGATTLIALTVRGRLWERARLAQFRATGRLVPESAS